MFYKLSIKLVLLLAAVVSCGFFRCRFSRHFHLV